MVIEANMGSSFGWIDFSSEHRTRVKTVLDLLAAPGVVDELGIGVIRDAFADCLFPGISTIQTRAKYFLIIPRILKDYESLADKQRSRTTLESFLAEKEMQVRIRLVEKYGKKERLGIIGVSFGTKADRDVLRQPSSVYWNGMRAFRIIRTDLSLAEYSRKHSGHQRSLRMVLEETREERGDDVDADDIALSPVSNMPRDDDWMRRLTITLTRAEAAFLHHQITATKPDSLLGQVLMDNRALEEFVALNERASFSDLSELPFVSRLPDPALRNVIRQAKLFWDILYGAHIRYNYLLQDRFGEKPKKREMGAKWDEWRHRMGAFAWKEWDTAALWALVASNGNSFRPHSRRFVEQWIDVAKRAPAASSEYDSIVVRQERANKGSRARLRPDNKDERVSGWVGIPSLDYRLPQVLRIVDDIHRAETGKANANAGL